MPGPQLPGVPRRAPAPRRSTAATSTAASRASPTGSVTQKIADYVTRELLPRADIVLDFHSGGRTLDFLPFAAAHVLPDKAQEARALAAVEAFAAPFSMQMLEIDAVGMFDTTAEALGKTFVTTELGGGGTARAETVAIARRGVRNLLRHAGILPGAPEPAPTRWLDMPSADCFTFAEDAGLIEPAGRPRRPGRRRRHRRPHPPG